MTEWLLAVGRMLGLGSFAGIRPSLTLAVIGVVGYFDWGIEANPTFSWLGHWSAIGIFVVLAILEATFDKVAKLDRLQDRLIMPYRLAVGGIAGAATVPFGWQGVVAGFAVGAGTAWFAQYTKHLSRPKSVPSEAVVALISAAEDLGAFLGSSLVLGVPYVGYACVGATGLIYWRVRDRRRAKYRRMRRAGAAAPAGARAGSSRTPGVADGLVAGKGCGPPPSNRGDAASAVGAGEASASGERRTDPSRETAQMSALEAGVTGARTGRGDDEG